MNSTCMLGFRLVVGVHKVFLVSSFFFFSEKIDEERRALMTKWDPKLVM